MDGLLLKSALLQLKELSELVIKDKTLAGIEDSVLPAFVFEDARNKWKTLWQLKLTSLSKILQDMRATRFPQETLDDMVTSFEFLGRYLTETDHCVELVRDEFQRVLILWQEV